MVYKVDTVELKKKMIENGYDTIGQLADASGIGRDTVAAVLSGKRRPSTAVMEKFMTTLYIEPQDAGNIFFVANLRNT